MRCQAGSPSGAGDAAAAQSGSSNAWSGLPFIGIRAGALGTACASSLVIVPSLQGGGSGGSNKAGGGGGGGDGGGGSGFNQQRLFDLAADEKKDKTESEEEQEESEPAPAEKEGDDAWKELVTPSDQVEEVPGQRSGTNRCVEIIIEGWPEVGALPRLVRWDRGVPLGHLGCPPLTPHPHAILLPCHA